MRRFTGGLIYLIGGALAGAASAYVMILNAGVQTLGKDGPWQSRAAGLNGSASIYVRSSYLFEGRLPAASGQLMEATAETDSEGQALSSACTYILVSTGALPQWWSIAAIASGTAGASQQTVIDADTSVRTDTGAVEIAAGQSPQPGNWLKLPAARQFSFIYLATPLNGRNELRVPPLRISRKGC